MKSSKWIIPGIMAVLVCVLWISSATPQHSPIVKEALQQIAKDKDVSPEEVKDNPELQQQIRDEIEARRSDPKFREGIRQKLTEQKQKEQEKPKAETGYGPISKNNLFKPLGSGEEKKGPSFALQITMISPENRAIILEFAGNKLHDVKAGDKIGNHSVELVEKGHVRLTGDEGPIDLRMEDVAFVGGGGGGGRAGRGGSRPSGAPSAGSSGSNRAAARAMQQEMKGKSPDEVRQMMEQRMQEFRQRGGGRGRSGGNRQRAIRSERAIRMR